VHNSHANFFGNPEAFLDAYSHAFFNAYSHAFFNAYSHAHSNAAANLRQRRVRFGRD